MHSCYAIKVGSPSKETVLLQSKEWMPYRHPIYVPLYPHITQVSRGLKLNPKVMFTFSFERYAKFKLQENRYFTLLTRLKVSLSWLCVHLLPETPDFWTREQTIYNWEQKAAARAASCIGFLCPNSPQGDTMGTGSSPVHATGFAPRERVLEITKIIVYVRWLTYLLLCPSAEKKKQKTYYLGR